MTFSTLIPGSAILIIISILSGIILGLKGRPLSKGWFNLHKFISLGIVVLLIILFQGIFSEMSSENGRLGLFFISLAGLIILFITGGLLSALKENLQVYRIIHILGTFIFLGAGVPLILLILKKLF